MMTLPQMMTVAIRAIFLLVALIRMRVDAGDLDLKSHLETCSKNATYISKTSQHDLLECVKSFIQDKIVREIQSQSACPYFSIMADEVTDTSN